MFINISSGVIETTPVEIIDKYSIVNENGRFLLKTVLDESEIYWGFDGKTVNKVHSKRLTPLKTVETTVESLINKSPSYTNSTVYELMRDDPLFCKNMTEMLKLAENDSVKFPDQSDEPRYDPSEITNNENQAYLVSHTCWPYFMCESGLITILDITDNLSGNNRLVGVFIDVKNNYWLNDPTKAEKIILNNIFDNLFKNK
jgi:hypothetical protein